ncbi:MAG TPA: hypothetical protein VIK04_09865 [Solirubrobacteraceae bacterium]
MDVMASIPFAAQLSCASRGLGGRRYRMQDLALACDGSAEDDEPVVDERVHEARMLLPAVLLAQVARPIPRTTTLEPHGEEHALKPTAGATPTYSGWERI